MRQRPIGIGGRRCHCGALAEQDNPTCRKCRARHRWARRKSRPDTLGDLTDS
jgi:hypothetical protein